MLNTRSVTCPWCGLKYTKLRTGLTYRDVYEQRWSSNPDPSTWLYKRRRSILGQWHAFKVQLWRQHLELCAEEHGAGADAAVEALVTQG